MQREFYSNKFLKTVPSAYEKRQYLNSTLSKIILSPTIILSLKCCNLNNLESSLKDYSNSKITKCTEFTCSDSLNISRDFGNNLLIETDFISEHTKYLLEDLSNNLQINNIKH